MASDTLQIRTRSEAKTIGQDGAFWPIPRQEMRDAIVIHERMAEDLLRAIANKSWWELADLNVAGWTLEQVETHWAAAYACAQRGHWSNLAETPIETADIHDASLAVLKGETVGQSTTLGRELIEIPATLAALALFIGGLLMLTGGLA